jgi:tetratricopeptide (TPR) repeat protein
MRSFALIAILASTALAEPADKLLDKGRKLEQQGKHAEAIAAYEEYLKAVPDDPVARCRPVPRPARSRRRTTSSPSSCGTRPPQRQPTSRSRRSAS